MKASSEMEARIRDDLQSMKGTTFESTCYCNTEHVWFDDDDAVPESPRCSKCGAEITEIHPAEFILECALVAPSNEAHREVLEHIVENEL